MKTENIKPPLFISKKINTETTMESIKTSLNNNPPHRAIKKSFSVLLMLKKIKRIPRIKFNVDTNMPKRIDL
jgi:hypothetical protein